MQADNHPRAIVEAAGEVDDYTMAEFHHGQFMEGVCPVNWYEAAALFPLMAALDDLGHAVMLVGEDVATAFGA
jgi:hypothetical protein